MYRVSVGISFINNERTLESAIRSVFAQTLRDWELILVDDGSTDRSLEIARSIRDPRVRVLSDGENRGLASRLNQVNRLARAPYIARMDADDIMHPGRLQAQVAFLDQHPEIAVADSACYTINAADRVVGLGYTTPLDTALRSVLRKGLLLHPACMGRREWFLSHPYDESLPRAQDWELWARTCEQSEFARIPSPLLFYRITGTGSGRKYLRKMHQGAKYQLSVIRGRAWRGIGRLASCVLQARIVAFHLALLPFALTATQSSFIHRRSRRLTQQDRMEARAALRQVQSTRVPGFRAPGPSVQEDLVPEEPAWLASLTRCGK